jgi:hypothetical protein
MKDFFPPGMSNREFRETLNFRFKHISKMTVISGIAHILEGIAILILAIR